MAKHRRTATATRTKIIRVPSAPTTSIIRVASPPRAKIRRHHRRRSGGSMGGGLVSNEAIQMAIGGALYGYAVKSGLVAKLPALPLVGRTGTAALVLDWWARHGGGQWAHKASRAAAAIAGYQLGAEGSIQGDDATTPGSMAGDEMDGYGDSADFNPLP